MDMYIPRISNTYVRSNGEAANDDRTKQLFCPTNFKLRIARNISDPLEVRLYESCVILILSHTDQCIWRARETPGQKKSHQKSTEKFFSLG